MYIHTYIYVHLIYCHPLPQEKLKIYPYVNGITHTNGARLINVHERIVIVTGMSRVRWSYVHIPLVGRDIVIN